MENNHKTGSNSGVPKVSIIMPTYNRGDFILESIESIVGQSFTGWELLVIDDGSTDNTKELVGSLKDQRVKYLNFGKIGYGIRLRSTAIPHARGEWIAFTDSDDLWAKDKLMKQVEALTNEPSISFCLTGGYNFRDPGHPLEYFYKEREGQLRGDLLIPVFESRVALFPQTLLFKRDCLPLIQEFVDLSPGADIEFIIGMAAKYKGMVLYEALLFRRLHDKNFSTDNWEHGYQEGLRMIRQYSLSMQLPVSVARSAFYKLYINYGEKCIRYRKTVKAIGRFLQAWKYRPTALAPVKKISKATLYAILGK